MMKVEIFGGSNEAMLQEEINEWLAKHPNIHIRFVAQSSVNLKEGCCCIISVWYEDFQENAKDLEREAYELLSGGE